MRMMNRFSSKRKKVIFFDLNNTIVDPISTMKECFIRVIGEWTGRWTPEEGISMEHLWATFQREWKEREKSRSWSRKQLKQHCLREALKPLPLSADTLARMTHRMRELEGETAVPYPDAMDAIAQLGRNYKIAIISNGSQTKQWSQLEQLGLNHMIQPGHLIASQQHGAKKPHPSIFRIATQQLSTVPQQCIMIGDSWRNDIMGACKAGMDAVWIRRNADIKQPAPIKLGKSIVLKLSNLNQLTEWM